MSIIHLKLPLYIPYSDNEAKAIYNKPSLIIAHTIPGRGVPEIEFDFKWHGVPPKPDEAKRFLDQLRTIGGKIVSEHQ